jgi:hypothetical protein
MKARTRLALCVFVSVAFASIAKADDTRPSASSARFDALKKRVGDWVEIGKDGNPTNRLVSSIRLTAAGNAVLETLFPGTDHEMVTVYHLDGDDLVLTHYCILGNQPRMKAERGGDSNRLVFECQGATNLKSEQDKHMHQATLTFAGDDRYKAEWTACQDGKTCHKGNFDLVRKPK